MQRVDSHPAFVLHAQPWRETSLLLEVLTRDHGRLGMIARGVRGARGQPLRALLQPLQPLHLSWSGRTDLLHLGGTEAAGAALAPHGDALLAAFYLNELLVRLLPRGEPQTTLFWRYAGCLAALQSGTDYAWELRRFERDLLVELGYGLVLAVEADGITPVEMEGSYRYEPEQGAVRLSSRHTGAVSGQALLCLAHDRVPDAAGLRELRVLMRRVLLHRLDGRELRSWQLLADLSSRGGPRYPATGG